MIYAHLEKLGRIDAVMKLREQHVELDKLIEQLRKTLVERGLTAEVTENWSEKFLEGSHG